MRKIAFELNKTLTRAKVIKELRNLFIEPIDLVAQDHWIDHVKFGATTVAKADSMRLDYLMQEGSVFNFKNS